MCSSDLRSRHYESPSRQIGFGAQSRRGRQQKIDPLLRMKSAHVRQSDRIIKSSGGGQRNPGGGMALPVDGKREITDSAGEGGVFRLQPSLDGGAERVDSIDAAVEPPSALGHACDYRGDASSGRTPPSEPDGQGHGIADCDVSGRKLPGHADTPAKIEPEVADK